MAAALVLGAHDDVLEVVAQVHVKGGTREVPTVAALLKAFHRTRDDISVPDMSMRYSVCTSQLRGKPMFFGNTEVWAGGAEWGPYVCVRAPRACPFTMDLLILLVPWGNHVQG